MNKRSNLAYAHLLRVPVLIFIVVLLFPYLADNSGVSAYLIGMYDITGWASYFTGAACALLFLALSVSTNTVLRTGYLRLNVDPPPEWFRKPLRQPSWLTALNLASQRGPVIAAGIYAIGIAWFLSGLVWLVNHGTKGWLSLGSAVAGLFTVIALAALTRYLTRKQNPRFTWYTWFVSRTPEGFLDEHGAPVRVQLFASNMFLVSVGAYLLGLACRPGTSPVELATLTCVVLLLTNVCWVLAFLAYLLDRWRVPLLLVLMLWGMSSYLSSDSTFPLKDCDKCAPTFTAAQALNATNGKPPILVATSGGGILASAWTARVLGALSTDPNFTSSVRLISSVSGGSVGSMYYLNLLRQKKLTGEAVFRDASQSSLDAVAWGLAYPDFLRTLPLPYRLLFGHLDRAEVLRHAWVKDDPELDKATLASWQANDQMPAVMFNSTVDETGERFVFANYHVAPLQRPVAARRVFFDAYAPTTDGESQKDVTVQVAAANSAAFPYVSPASRARTKDDDSWFPKLHDPRWFHLVDGGYYDNFGVASALDFLGDAYRGGYSVDRPILLVLIEAGAEEEYLADRQKDGTVMKTAGPATAQQRKEKPYDRHGWSFQFVAPPKGLIGMWQIAARDRNFAALSWVQELTKKNLKVVRFIYRGNDSPTSWHLTEGNKTMIYGQLCASNQQATSEVADFLGSEPLRKICDGK